MFYILFPPPKQTSEIKKDIQEGQSGIHTLTNEFNDITHNSIIVLEKTWDKSKLKEIL